jgi:phosphohistidine phosphatase
LRGSLEEHSSLSPNDDVGLIAEVLQQSERDTAVVGHMPHLDKLASFLLTGEENRGVVRFRNGGVVCLERQESAWRLGWMVTPELVL